MSREMVSTAPLPECMGWTVMALTARAAVLLAVAAALMIGSSAPRAEAATTMIPVGDNWFCNSSFQFGVVCPTTISVGDTVDWDFNGAIFAHTTTDCGATDCDTGPFGTVWDSGTVFPGGGPFQFTFTEAGVYPYYCSIHPSDMRGEITVVAAVGGIAELPSADEAPSLEQSDGATGLWWVAGGSVGAVAAMSLIGSLAFRRLRRA